MEGQCVQLSPDLFRSKRCPSFSSEFTLNGRTVDKRIVFVERVNPAEGLQ